MQIATKNLIFQVNEAGNRAELLCTEQVKHHFEYARGDFWQLTLHSREEILDEITIHSSDQQGKVCPVDEHTLCIEYQSLKDIYGYSYDVHLTVTVWREGELIHFKSHVENHEKKLRVLESRCPVMSFHKLCGKPEDDIFYSSDGMGKRMKNPWANNTIKQPPLNDYGHHQPPYSWFTMYPGNSSMAWLGFETADQFFYIGRHDEKIRLFSFQLSILHPLEKCRNMELKIAHILNAFPGETVESPAVSIGLLEGDWRTGADIYRAFAEKTFYHPKPKHEWMQHMHAFQRIHRRLVIDKYETMGIEDLPRVYLEGRKYGVDTLLFFDWWDTPFDAQNPIHDISPENAEKLKAAIAEVQRLGGRVITECNATYVVMGTPYDQEHGKEVAHLDLFGNEDIALHGSGKESIFRHAFPFRQFIHGCCGSKKWRETLISHATKMKQFGPDGMFYDCFGAWSAHPCYNEGHDHGHRADEQWVWRRKVFEELVEICGDDQALCNEVGTDIAAAYSQLLHTLTYNQYDSYYDYPYMFRYVFPEAIVTNRFINQEAGHYDRQMRYDFMLGMRFDVGEIYNYAVDREGGYRYAQLVSQLNNLRAQYADFMLDGRFVIRDISPLPKDVLRTEYIARDGRMLKILYNASDEAVQIGDMALQPDEMKFIITLAAE